jgi:acyl-CoA reductase-like NAD-dependent aldehyde dehydrogenase
MSSTKSPTDVPRIATGATPESSAKNAVKSAGTAANENRDPGQTERAPDAGRVPVQKTYKIYIGGKFPRSESGRYYQARDARGASLANICLSSRKDVREAVVAARAAQAGWSERSAYNRGQILYRIAEMLEGRSAQFVEELIQQGVDRSAAVDQVARAVDRWIHYAGWCDKYRQVFSAVNPVASSHFNFSVPEPMGVVGLVAPETSPLLGFVSTLAPVIAGGNTVVALASASRPLCAVSFAEVLETSDLPGGVVNILTGLRGELLEHFASHMDVNAVVYCDDTGGATSAAADCKMLQETAAGNVKRIIVRDASDWNAATAQSPYWILDCQEIKTTWHPIENIGGGGSGY